MTKVKIRNTMSSGLLSFLVQEKKIRSKYYNSTTNIKKKCKKKVEKVFIIFRFIPQKFPFLGEIYRPVKDITTVLLKSLEVFKENSGSSMKLFTSKCVFLCAFSLLMSANFLLHISHPNNFGPCTTLKWHFSIHGVA